MHLEKKHLEDFDGFKIKNMNEIYNLINLTIKSNEILFFRGHSDWEWKLKSTHKRKNDVKLILDIVRRRLDFLKKKRIIKNDLELLSEMQHNESETILIDFSSDILHSLWFAFSEIKNEKKDKKLYILKNNNEIKNTIEDLKEESFVYECPKLISSGLSQKSYFILDNKDWENDKQLITIIISKELTNEIMKFLKNKNISSSKMFPDWKGLIMEFKTISDIYYWDKGLSFAKTQNNKEIEKSIRYFDKAIEINPQNFWSYSDKGVSLDLLNKKEEAIKCFDQAIEINPQDFLAYTNKGSSLNNLGKFDKAIKCFDQAIGINPKDSESYIGKGNSLNNLRKFDEAIKCFEKAIEINPQDFRAYTNKGSSLSYLHRIEESIKYFDKAIEINPQDFLAYSNKGISFNKLGKFDKAIKCFDQAIEINPKDSESYNNKGVSLISLGKDDEAIKYFNEAINLDSKNENAHNNKGVIFAKRNKIKKAIKCYEKVIEINPNNEIALLNKKLLIKKIKNS